MTGHPGRKRNSPKEEARRKGKVVGGSDSAKATWDLFRDYVLDDALKRFMKEMKNMPSDKFMALYPQLMEYVKPKLARQETVMEFEKPINITFQPFAMQIGQGEITPSLTEKKDPPQLPERTMEEYYDNAEGG